MPLLSSVLLVDDDRTATFLHKLLVTKMGIARQVLVAEDGQQALDTLAEASAQPALILLDLNMPVLNGFDFLTRYAELPLANPRPVVALLSSSDHALDQARAQQLPVDAYLTKPLTRDKLQGVLQQYFLQ
jgi:CheY-like chemotaxis protein